MKASCFTLLVLILFLQTGYGQPGVLKVRVLDERSEPIANALVELFFLKRAGIVAYKGETDIDGNYTTMIVGLYDLKVTSAGFKTVYLANLIVAPERTTEVNIFTQRKEQGSQELMVHNFRSAIRYQDSEPLRTYPNYNSATQIKVDGHSKGVIKDTTSSGGISGKLSKKWRARLSGGYVLVLDSSNIVGMSAVDSQGRFNIFPLWPGIYEVRLEKAMFCIPYMPGDCSTNGLPRIYKKVRVSSDKWATLNVR